MDKEEAKRQIEKFKIKVYHELEHNTKEVLIFGNDKMASMVGEKGSKGQLSYAATKGAVIAATKSAAKELAEHHIRVNAIAPGMVGSERFKAVLEEKFAQKINDIPFGRLAEPEEVANLCLFLASDQSSYLTGQIIGIDGGAII